MLYYLVVKLRAALEWWRARSLHYSDRDLLRSYRFKNPYTISRKFLQARKETDVHQYGETYLTTYDAIAKACHLSPNDRVLEMGCGRGRGVLFFSRKYGAHVHGVDWVPTFIIIAKSFETPLATFSCENFMSTDLTGYTLIYLFGTCLPDDAIEKLISRFLTLPPATQIVTVSYPLTEYHPSFIVKKQFPARFPWGKTDIYIQIVRPS